MSDKNSFVVDCGNKCPFTELCEEVYSEPEMSKHRENCNCENCHYCDHYWGFLQGYHDAMEL